HKDLLAGVPSIVCMHYGDGPRSPEHFRLVLGYDARADEVVYHEPAEDHGAYRRMKRARFLYLWPLRYSTERWTLVRMRLEPSPALDLGPPSDSLRARLQPAEYAQRVIELKEVAPPGFTILIEPPFVVLGDEAPERVRAH